MQCKTGDFMKKASYLAAMITLLCNPVSGLELGTMSVESYLNEPLRAQLTVHDAADVEWADIRLRMASERMYERFGMQPPTDLKAIKFQLQGGSNGRYQVDLSSRQRIVEPILNLLIHVEEKQGSFYKGYTLLIDPPHAQESAEAAPAPLESIQNAPLVDKPAASTEPQQAAQRQTIAVKNRSLSIIAQESALHERYSVYQIMRALYLENTEAFERGNINRLRSGSLLVVPDESAIGAVARQKAINFVYSVSRDQPDQSSVSTPTGPAAMPPRPAPEVVATAEEAAPALPRQTAVAQPLQEDAQTWRSMASEFGSLASVVSNQNNALRRQVAAIKDLYRNVDAQQGSILDLSLRIDALQARLPDTALNQAQTVQVVESEPVQQERTPAQPQPELERLNGLLREREAQIRILNEQLLSSMQVDVAAQGTVDAEVDSAMADGDTPPVAPILTYVEANPRQSGYSNWLLSAALVLTLLALAWRERIWRRRLNQTARRDEPEQRPTTYSPSDTSEHDMGSLEIRHLQAKERNGRQRGMAEVGRSSLRLESNSMDDVKVEIEVLLAYEQYEEALSLLNLSEHKFGADAWIDYKKLEILAATNQCEEFLRVLNDKRPLLEKSAPILWAKVKTLRDRLCADPRISALG